MLFGVGKRGVLGLVEEVFAKRVGGGGRLELSLGLHHLHHKNVVLVVWLLFCLFEMYKFCLCQLYLICGTLMCVLDIGIRTFDLSL